MTSQSVYLLKAYQLLVSQVLVNVITIRLYNCVTVGTIYLRLPSVRVTIGSGNDADSILLA